MVHNYLKDEEARLITVHSLVSSLPLSRGTWLSSGVTRGQRTHLPAMENDGSQEPTSQRDEKQKRRRGRTEKRLRKKLKNRIRLMFLLSVRKEKSTRENSRQPAPASDLKTTIETYQESQFDNGYVS